LIIHRAKRLLMRECDKYTILLVDDEEIILRFLESALTDKGYAITAVISGEEALNILDNKPFDLVITDLVMAPVDGISVLKKSKQMNPEAAVVSLTGFGDMASAIEALRLNADNYILKPCKPEELFDTVSDCLKKVEFRRKIKLYEKILPVCCMCKKIRDDHGREPGTGEWMSVERYMKDKAKIEVTSTYCPVCARKVMEGKYSPENVVGS